MHFENISDTRRGLPRRLRGFRARPALARAGPPRGGSSAREPRNGRGSRGAPAGPDGWKPLRPRASARKRDAPGGSRQDGGEDLGRHADGRSRGRRDAGSGDDASPRDDVSASEVSDARPAPEPPVRPPPDRSPDPAGGHHTARVIVGTRVGVGVGS